MTDIAKLAIQAETKGVTQAQSQLDKLSTAAGKAEKSTKSMSIESGKAQKASNGLGGASRNLSFQLNQVAQQGAVTGNYLGALAIQLPDMLLSFGTLGILVGAAAGVMAGPLLTALSDTTEVSSDTSEEIDRLTQNFDKLGAAQKELLRLKFAEEQEVLAKQSRIAAGEYETAAFKLDRLITQYERGRVGVIEYKEESERLNKIMVDSKATIEENNQTLKDRQELLQGTKKEEEALADLREKIDARQIKEIENFDRLRTAILNKNKTEKELAIQNAAEINSELAAAYSNNLIDFNEYRSLRAEAQLALQNELTQIEEKGTKQRSQLLTSEQQKTLGYTGQFFGNLASIAQAGGEEQFQNYKNLASTQALISASLAVLGVLGDPAIPTLAKPIFAGAIGSLAAVQIAQIQSQEYQGARAMGGQVNKGNSYLVGENGPEIIHMNGNGNVQANHNLGGGGNNVTVHVNIPNGATKAEMAALIPVMSDVIYQRVFSAINGGGTASQAVRRRA